MTSAGQVICEGCGRPADAGHLARRLKRLENMTRYRPIHVQALFLAAASPSLDEEYLYSAKCAFAGEAGNLLSVLQVPTVGRPVEAALSDFQRRGYLLAHLFDCGEVLGTGAVRSEALAQRIPKTLTRIRRSFKPKRLVLIGQELAEFVAQFAAAKLEAALLLREGKPFECSEMCDGELAKELAAPLPGLVIG